jgi:hypothetical protein
MSVQSERWQTRRRTDLLAYVLTVLGVSGIFYALLTETSDYDAVAFGIATVSIIVAIVGISLAFRLPPKEQQPKQGTP